jgi:Na+/proline symporter
LFVGLIIPMTAALYWKKCNGPAAVASIVSGMVSWIVLEIRHNSYSPELRLLNYPPELVAALIGLVVLVVVTLATSRAIPALPLTDVDGRELEYKDRLGTLGFPRRSKR